MKIFDYNRRKGQLLLEAILAIGLGAAILALSSSLLLASFKSNTISMEGIVGAGLLDEMSEVVHSVAFENWLNIYKPPDGTGHNVNTKGTPAEGAVSNEQAADNAQENCTDVACESPIKTITLTPPAGSYITLTSIESTVGMDKNGPLGATATVTAAVNGGSSSIVVQQSAGTVTWNTCTSSGPSETDTLTTTYVGDVDEVITIDFYLSGTFTNFQTMVCTWNNRVNYSVISGTGAYFSLSKLVDSGDESVWLKHTPPDSSTRWGNTAAIRGISSYSNREVWVVGESGLAWRDRGTTTFGSTSVINESRDQWRNMRLTPWNNGSEPSTSDTLNSVTTFSNGQSINAVAAGTNGAVHQWNGDGGWTKHSGTNRWTTNTINSVSASDADHVWIAGNAGHVWVCDCSNPASPTWTQHSMNNRWGTGVDILGVSAYSGSEVWIVGTSGTVWRCSSGCGTGPPSWGTGFSGTGKWETTTIRSVSVLTGTGSTSTEQPNVFIAGDSGAVWQYKLVDGSLTWINHTPSAGTKWCNPSCVSIKSVSAYSTDSVYIVGDDGHVWVHDGTFLDTDGAACTPGSAGCNPTWTQASGTDRWATADLNVVSDTYSPQIYIGGASGELWQYKVMKWIFLSCGGVPCASNDVTVNGTAYRRNFYIQNVCRNNSNTTTPLVLSDTNGTEAGANACGENVGYTFDYSTQKVTMSVSWTGGKTLTRSEYITRWKNRACVFTNWSSNVSDTAIREECPTSAYDAISQSDLLTDDLSSGASLSIAIGKAKGTLTSIIWDVTGTDGVVFDAAEWQGSIGNANGRVRLQIAVSDSQSGPWTYYGYSGGSCSSGGWYTLGAADSVNDLSGCASNLNGKRYMKYKLEICRVSPDCTATTGASTPTVNDITFFYTP